MKNLFPIFSAHPDLIFLDSAASAQKPKVVLDAVREIHETKYANIHRGMYSLSLEATKLYDEARQKVASFFGVKKEEIVFTKNGTEAANLFAHSFGAQFLQKGNEVMLTIAEHHANLLPWMRLRDENGIVLKFVTPDVDGVFTVEDFEKLVTSKTKIITFPHVSNVTGQIFPVQEIAKLAKTYGAKTFLDACQSAPKLPINFAELGVDAAFFTGHKMGATGGTGGLYCKKELLEQLPPLLLGGDMVDAVSLEKFIPLLPPERFEAGTPALAEAVGLGVACDFLEKTGRQKIQAHDQELMAHALEVFAKKLPDLRVIGPHDPKKRAGVISFFHPKIHPHDLAQFLDTKNICVRSGLHCAEPAHQFLKLAHGSVRASFWIYNDLSDIDALVEELQDAENIFIDKEI